ncbi:phosphotransferase family protein [Kitasatospora sp. NPDC096147]|uniref:phosphotransferase family protein n=1 Tax=Kitasatospora sp. NPDC096147 TaxID=3364093 RepID=UPI0038286A54
MPVPLQRDPEQTRAALARWLTGAADEPGPGRTPEPGSVSGPAPEPETDARPRRGPSGTRTDVVVGPVTVPEGAGFSGEILLADAEWTEAATGERRRRRIAVRVAPTGHRVYPEDDWAGQVRLLRLLAGTDLPVPRVLGDEPSAEPLGAPFVVLEAVDGLVPADLPSYHREGWLADLGPEERAEVWNGGVDALAALHRLDPKELGADHLDRPAFGPTGTAQLLGHFTHHLDFYGVAPDNAPAAEALAWLRAHLPAADDGPASVLWGDARLGNILFDGTRPAALLDWEAAALGPAEADLAWYLHLDRHLSEGIGATRLAGLPDRDATVDRWERGVGRTVSHLPYHQVFAAYRFAVVTARVARLLEESGILPPGADFPLHRNATRLLATVLTEVAGPSRADGPALQRTGSGSAPKGGTENHGDR